MTNSRCHGHTGKACECVIAHLSRFIEPRVLILLKNNELHGYKLIEKMNDFPLSDETPDTGAVYRILRVMEKDGLVKSRWDTDGRGPARRIYKITKKGEERLHSWVVTLKNKKKAIEKFVKSYERR